jgi:hypothetical protein
VPKRTRETIRIVIAASPEESRSAAESLGVTPLAPRAVVQPYAIRKQSALGEITYAVLAAGATGAMYGGLDLAEALRLGTLASAQDSPVTIDYCRKSIAATLQTYPRLAGIGVTAGENMQELKGESSKEAWLHATYGKGSKT